MHEEKRVCPLQLTHDKPVIQIFPIITNKFILTLILINKIRINIDYKRIVNVYNYKICFNQIAFGF